MDFLQLYKEEKRKAKLNQKKEVISSIKHDQEVITSKAIEESNSSFSSLYYIPEAIASDTEQNVLSYINRQGEQNKAWKQLKTRKLQQWGRLPGQDEYITFPPWLEDIVKNLSSLEFIQERITINNVLINQYEPYEGIIHHTDGPMYHDFVVILSLESPCLFSFKPKLAPADIGIKSDEDVLSVYFQPRSLLVFADDLYVNHMHGIYAEESCVEVIGLRIPCINLEQVKVSNDEKVLRGRRTSLTFRQVKLMEIDSLV